MKRVLVTGARGLIGRHAVAALASRGYRVHAVSRAEEDGSGDVTWHRCDLLDHRAHDALIAAAQPTHLLHLAWYTEHGRFWTSPENLRWLAASVELVRRFYQGGGARAVIAGTCAEYDWRYGWCTEGVTPLAPRTLYGVTKDALRRVVEAHAAAAGGSAAWGRVFFLYGDGEPESRLVPSVIRALLSGDEARTTHGEQLRDFSSARDVGAGLAALLDSEVTGAVNVASGRPVAIAELVRLLGELTGAPEKIRLGAIDAPPDDPPTIVADSRRLRDEVGFTPAVALRDGLAELVDHWRDRLAAGDGGDG